MRTEAAGAGLYDSPWGTKPRLKILTVAELLAGEGIAMPPTRDLRTFKKAPKARGPNTRDGELPYPGPVDGLGSSPQTETE